MEDKEYGWEGTVDRVEYAGVRSIGTGHHMRWFMSYCYKYKEELYGEVHFGCTMVDEYPIEAIKQFEKTCTDRNFVLISWQEISRNLPELDREI